MAAVGDILMSHCTFYRVIEKCLCRLTASDKEYLPYLYVLNGNFQCNFLGLLGQLLGVTTLLNVEVKRKFLSQK
jgi:hypothetical protein